MTGWRVGALEYMNLGFQPAAETILLNFEVIPGLKVQPE
jgi:hypothetical protein